MTKTHPNALRLEAQDKREQAAKLIAEAEAIEVQLGLKPRKTDKQIAELPKVHLDSNSPNGFPVRESNKDQNKEGDSKDKSKK